MKVWMVSMAVGVVVLQGIFAADVAVTEVTFDRHEASGLTIIAGDVLLPGRGVWDVVDPVPVGAVLDKAVLTPPENVIEAANGERSRALRKQRRERAHRSALRGVYWPLCRWASEHDGHLPAVGDELGKDLVRALGHATGSLPVLKSQLLNVPDPPHAALVPGSIIEFDRPHPEHNSYYRGTNAAPILVELHPLENDGKHLVLLANGRLERRPVDAELMARLGHAVVPLRPDPTAVGYPVEATYRLLAQYRGGDGPGLLLTNSLSKTTRRLAAPDVSNALSGDGALLEEWSAAITRIWEGESELYDAPGMRLWAWLQTRMLTDDKQTSVPPSRRDRPQTDMMGVLGGRAALRETLQLQALRPTGQKEDQTIDMSSIEGVAVKAHPFADMLDGAPGGSYPLANVVPADQFFVGVPKPAALMPLLDDGAAFLARVGAGATGRALRYDLKQRYLGALGLNETMVRTIVANGAVDELAISTPDLFFADGTEIAVVARMKGAAATRMLLAMCGLKGASREPLAVKGTGGATAYWAVSGDLVIMGTQAAAVARILELARNGGDESLGRSDEFRYMLTRVPLTDATRVYTYFSDPFLRRLVGPEVKIGQLRRIEEKAKLQAVAYAAMLRNYHRGQPGQPSLQELVEEEYLPAGLVSGLSLGEQGIPYSSIYGALPHMHAIYASDLTLATTGEKKAYDAYRDSYTRFWRRFFDPVAIRVEEAGSELVATTYILPLLDNSLYDGVRHVINADPATPLRIPQISPAPTGLFSINLNEQMWREAISEKMLQLARGIDADMGALDQLGPALHVAIFDGEPVIAAGSRTMLGMGGRIGRRFNDEMAIPLLVSLLTRPCALIVELKDPEPVLRLLASGAVPRLLDSLGSEGRGVSYRIAGQDRWVTGVDFWGMSLRFSLAVEGHYLIIGNMPWREPIRVDGERMAAASGASIRLLPGSVDVERRALHLSALEGEREAAMQALGYLQPLLAAGIAPDKVLDRHAALFGYAPLLGRGQFVEWDGVVASLSGFGSRFHQEQPPLSPEEDFGTLQGIGAATVSMQLEDTGLRAVMRWSCGDGAP